MAAFPLSSLALPAAAAGLAYLDARYKISHDTGVIYAGLVGESNVKKYAKNERWNFFYRLEEAIANPTVANKEMIVSETRAITYKQGYDLILKYGTWLKNEHGIKPNDVVAIDMSNSPLFILCWFAVWEIGAKAALINHNLTGQPLSHSIGASKSRLVLADQDVKDKFTQDVMDTISAKDFREGLGPAEVVFFDDELQEKVESGKGQREPDSTRSNTSGVQMAMLIFTSGTTGLPKPAILSWDRVIRVTSFAPRWLKLRPDDRFYTVMPLYHSAASVLGFLNCLSTGCTFVIGKKFSARNFFKTCYDYDVTAIQYVGETCRYLLSAPPGQYDRAHKVRLAYGNGMRPDVWKDFKERFGIDTICEFYAATEAPGGAFNRSRNDFTMGAMGRQGLLAQLFTGDGSVLAKGDPDTDAPARDENTGYCIKLPANANEPGELMYKLPPDQKTRDEIFQGYYNNKKATEEKIIYDAFSKGDAFFRTGDMVRQDEEGLFYFHDRIGDTFRWKSENVSTNEVGDQVGQHPDVEEINVYGVEVPKHDGRAGCAAIVLAEGKQVDDGLLSGLAEQAQKNLPSYAVPVFLRICKEFEKTGTNKPMKNQMRDEGCNPENVVDKHGDSLYWFTKKGYAPFGQKEYDSLANGEVKL